ncbi:hypothetical protein ACJJTC_008272 [Scirpophaga incertulas]
MASKNTKQKAQDELRRLMAERIKKDPNKKIDNPLAKYNTAGQLTCVLCSSIVKSAHAWPVHINSKQHKENIESAKKLKELTQNFTSGKLKHGRSSPTFNAPPEKRLKGILKNSTQSNPVPIAVKGPKLQIDYQHDEEIKRVPLNKTAIKVTGIAFESKAKVEDDTVQSTANDPPLPEGFFDDPVLDAKVRNIEYKDPVEEEWEKFQKEIKEEATTSAEIIAGEQEEATAERQIEEIDEQIRKWTRVLELELKKEAATNRSQDKEPMLVDDSDDSENEEDIDEFLDWRSKQS